MAVAEAIDQFAWDWADEDLERLRQLVRTEETSAWEIGDQLLQLLPVGEPRVNVGVAATIRQLAAEVDAEPTVLTNYRKVSHAWPSGTRVPEATWAAHRAYMGPPNTAQARAETLQELPRNEHGKITVQAVKGLTKAGGRGKPGWHELLGQVSDTLTKAQKELDRFRAAIGDAAVNAKLREQAGRYAEQADGLAAELREIKGS